MLIFIGLGLHDERDISLKGLETIKKADIIYAESYTSKLTGTTISKMQELYGKQINMLSREDIENNPDRMLEEAKHKIVALLVCGDPIISTTHIDLRLRAHDLGIPTRIIHGASITAAAISLSGLQNYKFGKSTSIPHPYGENSAETAYLVIASNLEQGLHTLVYLDIDSPEGPMSINQALNMLLETEKNIGGGGELENRIGIGIARAGSDDPVVKADYIENLKDYEFGGPLHTLIISGALHFMEAEALVKLAGAPEEILEET